MTRFHLKKLKFWLWLGLGLATSLTVITFYHLNGPVFLQRILLGIRSQGLAGVVVFILVYNLGTVLLLPGSLLTLGGGALYGVWWGSLYVMMAAIMGAIAAFFAGRYLGRNWVSRKIQRYPQFQALDAALAEEGLKIVLLARLSPLMPFNLLNYFFGLTCVSWRDYVLGSIGMIPGTVMYVYIGSLAGDIALLGMPVEIGLPTQIVRWGVKLVGLLATVVMTVYITRIARRSLNQRVSSRISLP